MKNVLNIIKMIIPIFIFTLFIKVNAGEYNIDKATFDVMLEKNGDALITETWDVNYSGGGFTRFYKEIYKNVTEVEKYDDIEFKVASINGRTIEKTTDYSSRPEYTYGIENLGNVYRINFYKPIEQSENDVYQITYRVKNVVKATDDDKAIFVYRYVGANFDKTIDNIIINVNTTDNTPIALEYINKVSEVETKSGNFTLETTYSNKLVKCSVSVPQDYFEELLYVPMSKIKGYREPIELADIIGIGSLLTALFGFFFAITIGIMHKRKIRKIIEENPKIAEDYINRYEHDGIEALKIIKKMYYIYPVQYISLEILDLMRRDQITLTKDKITISKMLNGIDKEIVDILLNNVVYEEKGHVYKIDIDELVQFFSSTDKAVTAKRNRMITALSKVKLQLDKEYKFEKDEIDLVRMYFESNIEYNSINSYDVFENILSNKKTPDYKTILALGMSNYKSTNEGNFSTYPILVFSSLMDSNVVKVKSSSSSAGGCSSCSSCGGCGGGGAD